jgi:HSP20 family protein
MVRTLVPWNVPTSRWIDNFREEMSHLMDRFYPTNEGNENFAWFSPRTNVAETEQEFEITLDLPGMKADDFHVEVREGQLWVSGERKEETEEKGKTYHRIERHHGRFQRVFALGSEVDSDKVRAQYKDGVLSVIVPKSEVALPKKIAVKS